LIDSASFYFKFNGLKEEKSYKYHHKTQGVKMKVLIETITSRKGYKFFENEDELNKYLSQNCNKIAEYEILQEDENEVTDALQKFANEGSALVTNIYNFYLRQKLPPQKMKKLSDALQMLLEVISGLESCAK